MSGAELSADDARETLRRYGRWRLVTEAVVRFRYGDGLSHSRALGFQYVFGLIPLLIAVVGLAGVVEVQSVVRVLTRTLGSLTPGGSGDLVDQALRQGLRDGGRGATVALVAGLLTALLSLTTAMGQIERGANRIYGIQRDRPFARKYGRAAVLAVCAGLPAMLGFLLLVAGGAAARAMADVYGWSETVETAVSWLRWPVGALLGLLATTVLFRYAPRRRQPAMSWLSFGAGVALVLWLAMTGLLALYLSSSASFGQIYGPLTGVIALLLWGQLSALALFLGMAFAAQLEAVRGGEQRGAVPDPEVTTVGQVRPSLRRSSQA